MAATMIFMVLLCVWRWSWYFKIIWFLWIHHVPMHDWCKFRRDMFINSGDIAHWNMEKLPILYNGNFSLPWKRMLLLSDRCNILQATSDRSKQYVYQFWEQSVDNWTFYKLISIFHKFICITTITHKIVNIFIWPWLLTFIWPWLWVWPLTLTILRKYSFSIFSFFSKSRDVKSWRRTSNGGALTEAPFYKERDATNQKPLRLPVQKLWPIMWFSQKWWPWPWPLSDLKK